jgi:putative endonuclease
MTKERIELGKRGEGIATRFLEDNGYKILEKNYKSKLGEIDIIAQEDKTLVFVEVKTQKTHTTGSPQESVNQDKQYQLSKAAITFLKSRSLLSKSCRFDVVSIILNEDKTLEEIKLIKNAFYLNERYTY